MWRETFPWPLKSPHVHIPSPQVDLFELVFIPVSLPV